MSSWTWSSENSARERVGCVNFAKASNFCLHLRGELPVPSLEHLPQFDMA